MCRMDVLRRAALAFAVGALTLAAEAKKAPSRIDVTVDPAGARVVVDGEVRGTAPLQVFDLEPGRHLFHVEAPGRRAADELVKVPEGESFIQKHFELERERALILVRTEPSGADVKHQGVNLGQTPLFLPTSRTLSSCRFPDTARPGCRCVRRGVRRLSSRSG